MTSLGKRAFVELVATAFLLIAVVGSGIMAERLAGGNVAIALLANTLATGAALVALIATFGPFSGAHMNPAVTLTAALQGMHPWPEVVPFVGAQVTGAFAGVALAHVMFDCPIFFASQHARAGTGQLVGELVATFGLISVVNAAARTRAPAVPIAVVVGAYITGAYWFTSSTSFANPAVALARAATDTFAGIRPSDVPAFIGAELLGAAGATALFHWIAPLGKNGEQR